MSDLLVRVVKIDQIEPHPNADRLEVLKVGGWQIVSGKGNYRAGDTVVHIPPNVMIPRKWAETWEVTQHLGFKKDSDLGRVRAASLRGVTSYGFLVPHVDFPAELGDNLAKQYGITKWEPHDVSEGKSVYPHPLFHKYTDIQDLRNFPDKLWYKEPLVVTEKIHGMNSRVGWVRTPDSENGGMSDYFQEVVGTCRIQLDRNECGRYGLPWNLYSEGLNRLFDLVQSWGSPLESLIVFGEIYGQGVQDLHYGAKQELGYRVFDVAINGKYVSAMAMQHLQKITGIPTVPILGKGIFTYDQLLELANGNTTLDDTHIREGIVVRPMAADYEYEYNDAKHRMIFKVIGNEYMTRKGGTEFH